MKMEDQDKEEVTPSTKEAVTVVVAVMVAEAAANAQIVTSALTEIKEDQKEEEDYRILKTDIENLPFLWWVFLCFAVVKPRA